jgi:hypothetical protein
MHKLKILRGGAQIVAKIHGGSMLFVQNLKGGIPFRAGVPNLGDASPWGDSGGIKVVVTYVHLYQWGNAIDKRGDGRA